MSTTIIFYSGVGVFTLMVIGIILTALEFKKMNKDARGRNEDAARRNN